MRLTVYCSSCYRRNRTAPPDPVLTCGKCGKDQALNWDGVQSEDRRVQRCAVCDQTLFYVEADFPARLGCLIVIGCIIGFLVTENLLILIGSGLLNVILWVALPRRTICYKCLTEYRGVARDPEHKEYELVKAARFADHPKRKR